MNLKYVNCALRYVDRIVLFFLLHRSNHYSHYHLILIDIFHTQKRKQDTWCRDNTVVTVHTKQLVKRIH